MTPEDVLHAAAPPQASFIFPTGDRPDLLKDWLDHRAIGVVYDPEQERRSNYVPSVLGDRYGAFCWFEQSQGVWPLHTRSVDTLELETYPAGV